MQHCAEARATCLEYIRDQQQPDGSFLAYTGPLGRPDLFDLKTPFVTALILGCVDSTEEARTIASTGSKFLIREKSDQLTWNYWPKGPQPAKKFSIPDDLDDTFLALAALQKHNPGLITIETFPQIIKILTSAETKPGGPYNTWIIPGIPTAPWKDIDPVVNSNIGYFLKRNDIDLPELDKLAEDVIVNERYTTRYYYSFHSILYFISRFYTGVKKTVAIAYILKHQKTNGTWGNPLHTSLCLSALHNFGYTGSKTNRAVAGLIKTALKSDWSHQPLYVEEAHRDNDKRYTGSYALNAAFMYEALGYFESTTSEVPESAKTRKHGHAKAQEQQKTISKIHAQISNLFTEISSESRAVIKNSVETITGYDTAQEIPLLAYHTKMSLTKKLREKIPAPTIINLGVANMLGWIAYTIYDDLLDQEGTLEHLSVANIALRELTSIYTTLLTPKNYDIFRTIMARLDEANRWEYVHARIPFGTSVITVSMIPDYGDYSVLAHKSFGHALGPLTQILQLGNGQKTKKFKALSSFFKHYLIARQLNDDAHDWRKDLERGFFNPVSCLILEDYFRQQKSQSRRGTVLEPIRYPEAHNNTLLQQTFWDTTIMTVADSINMHLRAAKRALKTLTCFEQTDYYVSLLAPIERSAAQAVHESREMKKFLRNYS